MDQYEIVANKRTGIVMYASAGDRTRTYRVTSQDDPTTPQRHTFTKTGITTIYYTNRLVTSADIWKNYVLQEKWSEPFRNKQNKMSRIWSQRLKTWISTIKCSMYRNAFICMPAPGIELGPTGWQVKTFPRRHNDTHLQKLELQLFIIQMDWLLQPTYEEILCYKKSEVNPSEINETKVSRMWSRRFKLEYQQ